MFSVVNFDALGQASDFRIERRQVAFLCWMCKVRYGLHCAHAPYRNKPNVTYFLWMLWMQDSNPGSQTTNHQQTECPLTNKLSYRGLSKNFNSTACPCDQRAFNWLDPTAGWLSHLALTIYMFAAVNFDALAQASDFRIERRQIVFLCWMLVKIIAGF